MDLKNEIVDRASSNPFETLDLATFEPQKNLGLNEILKAIAKAKDDPRIKGILLEFDVVNAGAATTGEIREALREFKESGKFVVSYSDTYSQKAYYLAPADSIYLNPGMVEWLGLRSDVQALEKPDVEPDYPSCKFKSAVEPFMSERMSENREQTLLPSSI